jgi:hemerythrin
MCICNSVQFLTICSVFVGLFTAIDTLEKERTLGAYEALVGLVLKHFEDEEKLGLSEAHLAMHKGLVDIAVAKMGELKAGGAVDDALISLLQNWLKNHIKVTDQQTYGK